jgi:hypothetical protein
MKIVKTENFIRVYEGDNLILNAYKNDPKLLEYLGEEGDQDLRPDGCNVTVGSWVEEEFIPKVSYLWYRGKFFVPSTASIPGMGDWHLRWQVYMGDGSLHGGRSNYTVVEPPVFPKAGYLIDPKTGDREEDTEWTEVIKQVHRLIGAVKIEREGES